MMTVTAQKQRLQAVHSISARSASAVITSVKSSIITNMKTIAHFANQPTMNSVRHP